MKLKGTYDQLGYKAALVERRGAHAIATGGSGDTHLRNDRELLGRIADRFLRENGIYAGIMGRWQDAILGPDGLGLDPETGNRRLNRLIKEDWARFGEKPEVRGIFSWHQCERLALGDVANHGDLGVIITNRRLFQYPSATRLPRPAIPAAARAR